MTDKTEQKRKLADEILASMAPDSVGALQTVVECLLSYGLCMTRSSPRCGHRRNKPTLQRMIARLAFELASDASGPEGKEVLKRFKAASDASGPEGKEVLKRFKAAGASGR